MISTRIITYTAFVFSFFMTHAMDLQNTDQTNASAPTATTINDFLLSTAHPPTFTLITTTNYLSQNDTLEDSLLSRIQTVHLKSREELEREEEIRQIQALIDSDSDVNEPITINGSTDIALNICARKNYHQLIAPLVHRGANVNAMYIWGFPLLFAAQFGNNESIKLLLTFKADIDQRDENGAPTALIMAARHGHDTTVSLLLDARANIDAGAGTSQNNYGNTALIYAVQDGHSKIVKILLTRGAQKGFIKKDSAISGSRPVISALHEAVIKNNREIVELLLAHNADINGKIQGGVTPLHTAVFGQKELVALLLQKRANVDAQCDDGITSLHHAAINKNISLVKLLVKLGANQFITDENKKAPFDYFAYIPADRRDACRSYYQQRSTYLAEPALTLKECKSIFLIAFFFRDTPIIAKIIDSLRHSHKQELQDMLNNHSLDKDGNTVLIDAVKVKDLELVELLLKTGLMNCNKKNKKGFTALHYALLPNSDSFADIKHKIAHIINRINDRIQLLNVRIKALNQTIQCRPLNNSSIKTLDEAKKTLVKLIEYKTQKEIFAAFIIKALLDKSLTPTRSLRELIKLTKATPIFENDRELEYVQINKSIIAQLIKAGAQITPEIIALSVELNYSLAHDLLLHKVGIMNVFE